MNTTITQQESGSVELFNTIVPGQGLGDVLATLEDAAEAAACKETVDTLMEGCKDSLMDQLQRAAVAMKTAEEFTQARDLLLAAYSRKETRTVLIGDQDLQMTAYLCRQYDGEVEVLSVVGQVPEELRGEGNREALLEIIEKGVRFVSEEAADWYDTGSPVPSMEREEKTVSEDRLEEMLKITEGVRDNPAFFTNNRNTVISGDPLSGDGD